MAPQPDRRPSRNSNNDDDDYDNDDEERPHYANKRARRKPSFYLEQREISKGLLQFHTDEIRGLDQPDHVPLTPTEQLNKQLRQQGMELFSEYLRPKGWKWVERVGGYKSDCRSGEYVWRAPGVSKTEEKAGINMFPSYQAIAEQYEQDGKTMKCILDRAAAQPNHPTHNANWEDDNGHEKALHEASPPESMNRPGVNVKVEVDSGVDEEVPPDVANSPESIQFINIKMEHEDDDVNDGGEGYLKAEEAHNCKGIAVTVTREEEKQPFLTVNYSIRERLSRIEKEVGGYPSNQDANIAQPIIQRIRKLEEDCDIALVPSSTLMDRVSNLEKTIGLPPL